MTALVRWTAMTAVRRPRAGSLGPLLMLLLLLGLLLVLGGLATACTESTNSTGSGTGGAAGSEVPDAVKQLPVTFYQGASAEPGATFDLATVRSVTADPLQSVVVDDLEQLAAQKSPQAYYRYSDVQVLNGSCSGQGSNRVCEIRVQRLYDLTDLSGQPQGAHHDTRVFRAKPVGNEWKLFETQVDGRWLSDQADGAGGSATPGG